MRYDKTNRAYERLKVKAEERESQVAELQIELSRLQVALDGTMHEIRRFSGELSKQCEDLSKLATRHGNSNLSALAQTALFTSGMISARLAYTDIELNPQAIRKQHTLRVGIYKKFEKAKYILGRASVDKRVKIKLSGGSHTEIEAIQPFDLLPFVILDNAIKYSPEDQDVLVEFDDPVNQFAGSVTVTSVGPRLSSDEKSRIFDQSYRGSNVDGLPGHGDGLGLYLAKKLCSYHDLKIDALPSEDVRFVFNGREYADFRIIIAWGSRL